jgi:hypothetical protein
MPVGTGKVALLAAGGAGDAGPEPEFEHGAVLLLEDGTELLLADGSSRLLLVPQEDEE